MIPNQLRTRAMKKLKDVGIESAGRDVRLLWEFSEESETVFEALLGRRSRREPMSHILGHRAFFENDFHVTVDVLDPRPETEVLVLAALENEFRKVLDLGTGSGCILLSLLAKRPGASGLGVDISEQAISVAKMNAEKLEIDNVQFSVSNWCDSVEGRYDLIVSNPPYISAAEIDSLAPEVKHFEPRIALTDEDDGLSAYRTITSQLDRVLDLGGVFMVEIGPNQAPAVCDLMRETGLSEIEVLKDLDGRDRVVSGKKAPV